MKWIATNFGSWCYCTEEGEVLVVVRQFGGSYTVNFKGECVAIRPDLESAKRAGENCVAA